MGLQNHLSDLSSESFIIILAKSFTYFHSLILTFLHNLGLLSPPPPSDADRDFVSALGSGLCDNLTLNRSCSYCPEDPEADCAVCLCRLARGDRVRSLACRHVFHKDCFDAWLHHLNFSCPLCRAPVDHVHCASARLVPTSRRVNRISPLFWP